MRIACIQMRSTMDVDVNLQAAAGFIKQAAKQRAQLVVLPEMFATMGMDTERCPLLAESFGEGKIQNFLSQQAKQHNLWLVGGTIPIWAEDHQRIKASCLCYNNQGQVVSRYDKIHLFDVIVGDNERYQESNMVEPGEQVIVTQTPWGRLGFAVCYDLRFPELFRKMVSQGAEFIVIPSAFIFKTGQAHWEVLLRARAIENLIFVAAAGQGGVHDNGRHTFGHSMIINPWGELLASTQEEPGIIWADLDFSTLNDYRKKMPVLEHRKIFSIR